MRAKLVFSPAGQEVVGNICLINLFAKAVVGLVGVDPAGLLSPLEFVLSQVSSTNIF